jgi:Family of unknown function (DUF5677)
MSQNYLENLRPLCDKLYQTALQIIDQADLKINKHGMTDPNILALALLSRTLSHFRAVILLQRQRMVVEARILTRCCFENLYMVGGLQSEGHQFAQRMMNDDQAGRKGRIRFAMETETIFESFSPEMREAMRQRHEQFLAAAKVGFLRPSDASAVGPYKDTYIAYSQFSGDAAHPTITALSRHWSIENEAILDVEPEAKEDELDHTLDFACIAILGIMVAVNEMIGFRAAGKALPDLSDEVHRLQTERWGSIEAVGEPIEIRTQPIA